MTCFDKGQLGEQIALEYLKKLGYSYITRNFKSKVGEIDLIVEDQHETIVFVEVKYYHPESLVEPEYIITSSKKRRLTKTALYYITKNNLTNHMFRFDLIIIKEDGNHKYYKNIIIS
jgi:putative endonuclease